MNTLEFLLPENVRTSKKEIYRIFLLLFFFNTNNKINFNTNFVYIQNTIKL